MLYLYGLKQYLGAGFSYAKQLPTKWKELTLGLVLGMVGMLFLRKPVQQPLPLIEVREVVRTVDRIVEVEKWRDREVVKWKDRRVVVTKPDGTRVETTEVSGSQSREEERQQVKTVDRVVEKELTVEMPVPVKKPYQVGLGVLTGHRAMLTGSARLGSSDFSLFLNVGTSYKEPTFRNTFAGVGLSVEF